MKKEKKSLAGRIAGLLWTVIPLMILTAGIILIGYPTVSNLRNVWSNEDVISDYGVVVDELKQQDFQEIWDAARAYNEQHRVNILADAFEEENQDGASGQEYDNLLNPMGNAVMGYLEIPKIDVRLAIYHGVGLEALENGCGHLEGTSLPVGGTGTHAVLSAHRGLPSARLFTDLDQLAAGDVFYMNILDETLAYEVDQILTVLPDEVDALAIEADKDLVTLVTCTPYGVNSHRLLVRGIRTEYTQQEEAPVPGVFRKSEPEISREMMIAAAGAVFAVLLLLVFTVKKIRRKR